MGRYYPLGGLEVAFIRVYAEIILYLLERSEERP